MKQLKAHEIISKTSETVLFLRDKKYENPNALSALKTAIIPANSFKVKEID